MRRRGHPLHARRGSGLVSHRNTFLMRAFQPNLALTFNSGLKKDGTQLYLVKGACVAQCKDGYFGGASTEPEAATRLRRRHRVRVNIKKRDTSPIVAPTCQKCPDGVATCSSQTVALTWWVDDRAKA